MSLEARIDRSIARLMRRLISGGQRMNDVAVLVAAIRSNALAQFDDETPDEDIDDYVMNAARAAGVRLRMQDLSRIGNPRQNSMSGAMAVCLWLLAFRDQTLGLGGLWMVYISLDDPTLELPEAVRAVCRPAGEDGEDQEFIHKILGEISAQGGTISEVKARDAQGHWTDDRLRVVDWVIATRLKGSQPTTPAAGLVLRGENTLMDFVRRRVYREIDAIAAELRRPVPGEPTGGGHG